MDLPNENEIRENYKKLTSEKEKITKKIEKEKESTSKKITILKEKSTEKIWKLKESIDLINDELSILFEKSNFTDLCSSCNTMKFKNELDIVTVKDMKLRYHNKNGPKADGLLWCGC